MPKLSNRYKFNSIYRIIDANINRAKEGLRVCEEIIRFILNNYRLTKQIKKTRHQLQITLSKLPIKKLDLLKERNSLRDVGRHISIKERERKHHADVFFANIQRTKESVRVLEEFSKLINKDISIRFKQIRYTIYEIEKKVAKKF